MAGNFCPQPDRGLADFGVERHRLVDGPALGLLSTTHLNHRHQMRRVERVSQNNALGMGSLVLELRDRQRGRTGGNHHIGRDVTVDLGHQVCLDRGILRPVLLHEIDTIERFPDPVVTIQIAEGGPVGQPKLFHQWPGPGHEGRDILGVAIQRVPAPDLQAPGQKIHSPG